MKGRQQTWRMIKDVCFQAVRETSSQQISLVAAGCAFYATLALFPTITMLISLYGLAFNPHSVQPQLHYLERFMPPEVYRLISQRIESLVAQPANGLGLSFGVSLLFSLWSASTGTKSVLNALTLVYHQEETRGLIRFHLVALGMTFVAVLGVVLAIATLVLVPLALVHVWLPQQLNFIVGLSCFGVMVGFVWCALGLLYRFGPAGRGQIFYAPGAALATLLWLLASWGFSLYVGRFAAYSVTYGPLAAMIGLMMWFYLSAYVVLFGAEFNAALDQRGGKVTS